VSRITVSSSAPVVHDGEPARADIVRTRDRDRPFAVKSISPRRTLSTHESWEAARDWIAYYGGVLRQ
jgi:hypothetical protein